MTPEQKALRAAKADAWKARETISSKGVAYEIAAMRARTGLGAEFNAGIPEFLGVWSKTNDLSQITGKVKNQKYWDCRRNRRWRACLATRSICVRGRCLIR